MRSFVAWNECCIRVGRQFAVCRRSLFVRMSWARGGLLSVSLAALACSPGSVRRAEFRSLDECLSSIQQHSGSRIRETVTDRPRNVSGYLQSGAHFGCRQRQTGTKGTFWEGWYDD